MKEYQAVVWLPGQSEPGQRVTVVAKNSSSARVQLVQRYGDKAVITLLDDVDLRPR